jgi:hypothetical protein
MPIDANVLNEARGLVVKAGMAGFSPSSSAPLSAGGHIVEIALIDAPVRDPGTPNFDKPDPARPGVIRSASIMVKIRDGVPLEPVLLFQGVNERRYKLIAGFHRLHLCAALGFTHIYADVTDEEF